MNVLETLTSGLFTVVLFQRDVCTRHPSYTFSILKLLFNNGSFFKQYDLFSSVAFNILLTKSGANPSSLSMESTPAHSRDLQTFPREISLRFARCFSCAQEESWASDSSTRKYFLISCSWVYFDQCWHGISFFFFVCLNIKPLPAGITRNCRSSKVNVTF